MNEQYVRQKRLVQWLKENHYAYWSVCLFLIIFLYLLPECLITTGYTPTELAVDGLIPFLPGFVYFYILWFPLLVGTGLWLLIKDGFGYRRYMIFLTISYAMCAAIYLSFPNGQDLRPDALEANRLSTWILSQLYQIDTNTNVLPSLHVVGSIGAAAAICTTPTIKCRGFKAVTVILSVLISVSTVFVKQHALLDVAAGLVVGFLVYALTCLLTRRRKA